MKPRLTAARGFTLIESLVAMTVLSASLAVSAASLVQTLHNQRRATERSTALRLAASFAEELRGLRRADGRALRLLTREGPADSCGDGPADCAAEAHAAARLQAWFDAVAATLPEGATATAHAPDPAVPAYDIAVEWPDTASGTAVSLQLRVVT